nr:hypothetical protein [Pneumocystis sp. 'ludovicianus']
MKKPFTLYNFNNNNLIKNSTLYLKKSKIIQKIINQYFKGYCISNLKIDINLHIIKIRFYYYSDIPVQRKIRELEDLLMIKFNKLIRIIGIPLKYPYMDSKVLANYLETNSITTIKNQFKEVPPMIEDPNPNIIPAKFLSGITIKISGRSQKYNKRSSKEEIKLGTLSKKYLDKSQHTFMTRNGLNSISVTLHT